jgi:NAD(P)-dependent dehydrogenase (short-subunit alcohol dehydrogenase family)
LPGNLRDKSYCQEIIDKTIANFGKLNILVNNAAVQHEIESLKDLKDETLEETFDINILSMFRVTRAALKHLHEGDCIINTTSVNAFKGHKTLLDYTSTKGAILGFTRALSLQLADKKIRVNAVAPVRII